MTSPSSASESSLPLSRLAQAAFYGGMAILAVALAMGPLHRFEIIGFPTARLGLTAATLASPVVALLALAAIYVARPVRGKRGWPLALAGLAAAVLVAGFIWSILSTAQSLPMIHDITTDTADPPAFVAALAERGPGTNDPNYAGAEIARQQTAAYPDIKSHAVAIPPAAAYERAMATAQALKWRILAADPAQGRIEAVDTTLWFGFKDDVVIRIRATPDGSIVDVRSASRIGLSDLGANTMRIRRFLAIFDDMKNR